MRSLKKSEYVLSGILALLIAYPIATGMTFSMPLTGSVATVSQQQALNNHADYRTQMRDYQKATELCTQLRASGMDVTCPGVNDYDSIVRFLNGDYTPHTAALSSSSSALNINDLTDFQKNLLRWYQRINSCPLSMKETTPAFYGLCESMINPNAPTIQGWRNVNQAVSGQEPATLNQIIDANKGATKTW